MAVIQFSLGWIERLPARRTGGLYKTRYKEGTTVL